MDSAAAVVPARQSHQRPTQEYYRPRRLLENGRGPTAVNSNDTTAKPHEVNSKSTEEKPVAVKSTQQRSGAAGSNHKSNTISPKNDPKQNRNNENQDRQRKDYKEPQSLYTPPIQNRSAIRPLMSTPVSWGSWQPSYNEKQRRPQTTPNHCQSKPIYNQPKSPNIITKMTYEAPQKTPMTNNQPKKPLPMTQSQARTISPKQPLVRPNSFNPMALPDENTCLCERPDSHVVCKRCGYETRGRVQIVCPQHPTKLFLTDLRQCPEPLCKSMQILERCFDPPNLDTNLNDSDNRPLDDEFSRKLSLTSSDNDNDKDNSGM
ncbi:hypothetical protein WR25_04692 [Diploscapter pachys]|uniref:Uncharacterized protein n=1 Tax=Diploscapter pachys TaxID=2018661 RepID=A0A2A2J667_9BILA|nr:hypothetical protein WR25_04692 [Diploscapter pachys]